MKKIKISLVAAALILSTGISIATSAKQSAATYCSSLPNGQGTIAPVTQFNCGVPGTSVCCYSIPNNVVITKGW